MYYPSYNDPVDQHYAEQRQESWDEREDRQETRDDSELDGMKSDNNPSTTGGGHTRSVGVNEQTTT